VPAIVGEQENEAIEDRRPAALSSGRKRVLSPSNRSPPATGGQSRVGSWVQERLLGTGGFGQVILWQNEDSGERIALKTCADLSEKNKLRWRVEVDMMYRLTHPNLVTALPVPECLLSLAKHDMAILGMEWCDKGSLRQCFSVPEHRCGLPETRVLLLMKDIAGAIEYLHEQRIIHRDIKPENIVLKDNNGRIVHKLIDLGYAKELDHTSMAKTFVGTFVYLAPELFLNTQQYTRSVSLIKAFRQAGRQTDRQTGRQTDRQTDRH
jgi:serine/threonine protein kinase